MSILWAIFSTNLPSCHLYGSPHPPQHLSPLRYFEQPLPPSQSKAEASFQDSLAGKMHLSITFFPFIWKHIPEIFNVHQNRENSMLKSHGAITQTSTFINILLILFHLYPLFLLRYFKAIYTHADKHFVFNVFLVYYHQTRISNNLSSFKFSSVSKNFYNSFDKIRI